MAKDTAEQLVQDSTTEALERYPSGLNRLGDSRIG
jgi:hypothetical protein